MSYSFRTTGLEQGSVVTMWWVIFNDPDECQNPITAIGAECDLPDLFNPDTQPSVMRGDGHSVGKSGHANLGGSLREGEITNFHPAFEGTVGLMDAIGAEIHLILRTHGPMIPGMIDEMRSTYEAGCTPEPAEQRHQVLSSQWHDPDGGGHRLGLAISRDLARNGGRPARGKEAGQGKHLHSRAPVRRTACS